MSDALIEQARRALEEYITFDAALTASLNDLRSALSSNDIQAANKAQAEVNRYKTNVETSKAKTASALESAQSAPGADGAVFDTVTRENADLYSKLRSIYKKELTYTDKNFANATELSARLDTVNGNKTADTKQKNDASSQTAGDSQPANQGSDGTGTNAGNSQTAEPVTAEEKNNVETGKVATADSLGTGETEVKGEPPPETASTTNNTVKDNTVSVGQTGTQTSATTTITPNQLHQYPTYTYGLTLHLLSPDTYNAMARGEEWLPSAKTLISSAGRWGKDENNKSRFTRPTQFADDFYFDGLTLSTVIGLNSQGRASNVIDISFNLIEPYGLTLLNRLLDMAKELGIPNYLANPYVLQIDFFGNDDVGLPVHPILNITKYIPIKLIEMKMKVGAGGTNYACRAVPYNHVAFGQNIASTPANFEIKAKTVRDFFQNDADEGNFSSSLQKNQERAKDVQNLQNSLNAPAPVQSQSQSRRGPQQQQQQATTQAIIDAKKQAMAKPYEVDSYNSAYNTYQKFLVSSKSQQHATTIKFIIDEEIANSDIVYEKKSSMSSTTMNNNKDSKAINKSYAGANRGGSGTTGPQLNVERFNINAGTNVMEVVNLVMRNSTYITDQLKDTQQTDKNGNPLKMFKVVPQIQLKDFDFVKNEYSYDVTFTIKKYSYHNSKHPLMSVSSQEQILRSLRKRYDYIYTGKNTDIIDFSIDFDALFYTAVNVGTKNLEALTESQDATTETNADGSGAGKASTSSYTGQLSKQRADVVNPNQVHPVSGDLSAAGGNAGQNSSIQKAADVMNSVYSSARGDMLNLKIKIIGDPDFIKQDDVFLNPANTNYPADNEAYDASGSILTDRGDIFAKVTFKTPVDIDQSTGGLRHEDRYLESNFSGIYKLLKVTSEFRGGKFEQSLDAVRFHDDIADPRTANSKTQRTDVTASTLGGQSELNTPPPANTPNSAKSEVSEETQSYSSVEQAKIENTDNTQTSKLEDVAANGETRNVTEVQASTSTAKDSTADATAAAPPAAAPDPTPTKDQQIKELEDKRKAINSNISAKEKALSAINQQSLDINKQIKAARAAGDLTLSASLEEQYKKLEAQSLELQEMIRVRSDQVNAVSRQINELKGQ